MARPKEHGMSTTRIYYQWYDMIRRCYDSKDDSYESYGERGIEVCKEWKDSFLSYYQWAMNNGYKDTLQIDRIDVDGDYCPDNCQFVTPKENCAIGKRRFRKNNTSGYEGISYHSQTKKWWSRIMINGKSISLGLHTNIYDAVKSRIDAEITYFGEQKTNLHFKEERVHG